MGRFGMGGVGSGGIFDRFRPGMEVFHPCINIVRRLRVMICKVRWVSKQATERGLILGKNREKLQFWLKSCANQVNCEVAKNQQHRIDRKSTRLNSSHANISYAV